MRRKTNKEFIQECILKWGDRYDYSNVNYVSSDTYIDVVCKDHGLFKILPKHHLRKQICPSCTRIKISMSTSDFIRRSVLKHGDKYDYINVNYVNNKTKVSIICKKHGAFLQTPKDHLNGYNCNRCRSYDTEKFIKKANTIHSNLYDYDNVIYKNYNTKVKISCKLHGFYQQSPSNHLSGSGCSKCKKFTYPTSLHFIEACKNIHGDKYDYKKTIYNGIYNDITIICKKHGEFRQKAYTHLAKHGCSFCNSSKGELFVSRILENNNIKYTKQKSFASCINKRPLKFDFYLDDQNLCIEYDGRFHYEPIFDINSFEKQVENDKIKNDWCEKNRVRLLRISYIDYDNIESILKKEI